MSEILSDGDGSKIAQNKSPYSSFRLMNCISSAQRWLVPVTLVLLMISLILWDMKTVHEMSQIIHDDHSDLWVPMNGSELMQWYTPVDICMLRLSGVDDVRQYRSRNCSSYRGGKGIAANRLFCGLGSSIGKPCTPPLSNRQFFTSRLKDDILGNPFSGLLKQSLHRLADRNMPIIFMGDTISKQNQEALLCEIMRTDNIEVFGTFYGVFNGKVSNYSIKWKNDPNKDRKVDVYFFHMPHASTFSIKSMGDHNHSLHHLSVSNASEVNALKANSSLHLDLVEANDYLLNLTAIYKHVMIVANIGVWYNSRERFRKDLHTFLDWLNSLGLQKNIVMFRETTSQHWNNSVNGYFSSDLDSLNGQCSPIEDLSPQYDWRNKVMKSIIESEELMNITIIPFRDITAPLYNMHPYSSDWKDCTSFCYFPMMWQSVWQAFDLATEIYALNFNVSQN